MKRIGIMTLYYNNNNYGGIAQAYALAEYLIEKGFDAEIISYRRTPRKKISRLEQIKANGMKEYIKEHSEGFCEKVVNKFLAMPLKRILAKKYEPLFKQRTTSFERSRENIPHTEKVYDENNVELLASEYDVFLTGSDQVWKPGVIQGAYVWDFLSHEEEKKCLSYASSIATTVYPDWYLDYMRKHLKKFEWISVREKTAQEYLKQITGKDVSCVLDPTFLLDDDKWLNLASERIINERYIFAYFLGNSIWQRKKVKQLAKATGRKIVTLPHLGSEIRLCDCCFGDFNLYDVTLNDFLSLILFADCVVTDSFHAVVFSNIFKKDFWVFERKILEKKERMGSRIDDLLTMLNEMERKVDKKWNPKRNVDFKTIDFKKVKHIVDREKMLSEIKFLDALSD